MGVKLPILLTRMTTVSPPRIQFLDLARLVAVFMMIQGHTIKTLLAPSYQDTSLIVYGCWRYVRGFTAPMFMLIAGMIFMYLLFRQQPKKGPHPRYRKALIRAGILLVLGYWLNCGNFFSVWFSNPNLPTSRSLWRVDVLQSIAAGLLVLLLLHRSFRSSKKALVLALSTTLIGLLTAHVLIADHPLSDYLPMGLSQYLTGGEGSPFPSVPWMAYMLIGGLLGCYLSGRSGEAFNRPRFALTLGAIGLGLVGMALAGEYFEEWAFGRSYFWTTSPCLVLFRAGWVILVCGLLVLVARGIGPLPTFAKQISRNALWLYVGHLQLLFYLRSWGWTDLSPIAAILTALGVLLAMALLTQILVFLGNKTGVRL